MSFRRKSHRFDPVGVALADRHYSRQKPGSPQFMPPGSCRHWPRAAVRLRAVTNHPDSFIRARATNADGCR
jgi:hypothetical protein